MEGVPRLSGAPSPSSWRAVEAAVFPRENSYGMRVRFAYIAAILARTPAARRILDVGCGTGENLTIPLARAFPERTFLGVDSDPASLAAGREAARAAGVGASVAFAPWETLEPARRFDLVIASEVIEHVEEPGELLHTLRERIADGGRIVLTLPNGRGIFEIAALGEVLLNRSGIQALLRPIARAFRGRGHGGHGGETAATGAAAGEGTAAGTGPGTLAVSPHVNFFSRSALLDLVARAGFSVRDFRARSFACGYIVDYLVRPGPIAALNVSVAAWLPPVLSSGWMLVIEPDRARAAAIDTRYRRTAYGRFRRRLNLRRWGLAG